MTLRQAESSTSLGPWLLHGSQKRRAQLALLPLPASQALMADVGMEEGGLKRAQDPSTEPASLFPFQAALWGRGFILIKADVTRVADSRAACCQFRASGSETAITSLVSPSS